MHEARGRLAASASAEEACSKGEGVPFGKDSDLAVERLGVVKSVQNVPT